MFSKKLHADVKKSTQKIQDVRKEYSTRFKHLRIILGSYEYITFKKLPLKQHMPYSLNLFKGTGLGYSQIQSLLAKPWL